MFSNVNQSAAIRLLITPFVNQANFHCKPSSQRALPLVQRLNYSNYSRYYQLYILFYIKFIIGPDACFWASGPIRLVCTRKAVNIHLISVNYM